VWLWPKSPRIINALCTHYPYRQTYVLDAKVTFAHLPAGEAEMTYKLAVESVIEKSSARMVRDDARKPPTSP
jgi:hypothetical protein